MEQSNDVENQDTTGPQLAFKAIDLRIYDLRIILDNVWILICSIMVILAQVGFLMKETGSIRMTRNSAVLLKTILVICTSSLTFFIVGFGFSVDANGGIMG